MMDHREMVCRNVRARARLKPYEGLADLTRLRVWGRWEACNSRHDHCWRFGVLKASYPERDAGILVFRMAFRWFAGERCLTARSQTLSREAGLKI